MALQDVISKIPSEPVYLVNKFDNVVVRSDPNEKSFYAKFKGGKESRIAGNASIVLDTILQGKEITGIEYEEY